MTERPREKPNMSTAFLLSQVGARAAQIFGELLAPLKLTPPDAGILRLLKRSPGISQQELARRLDMHASRLVAVIDALEQRGLVAREMNADDRRLYSLQLTGKGRDALEAIGAVARAQDERVCAGLSTEERGQLAQLLTKIALRQGLAPGIHPGYRSIGGEGQGSKGEGPRSRSLGRRPAANSS
jgi:DNA-binding MarR family transcriptional regulator